VRYQIFTLHYITKYCTDSDVQAFVQPGKFLERVCQGYKAKCSIVLIINDVRCGWSLQAPV